MNRKMADLRRFTEALDRYRAENCGIVVAFSGGMDSTLLLHWLLQTREARHLTLFACHVHHGIRGDAADRDEAFCRRFCEENRVEYRAVRVDVPTRARESGKGIEETARELRYAELEECRRECGADWIMTAHHADDNLETVLLHLTRGSGLAGLCGIPEQRGRILRPLLAYTKEELTRYAEEDAIPFVQDESNFDTAYSRNAVRAQILPVLKRLNPAVAQTVSRTCRILREEEDYLSRLASESGIGRDTPMPLLRRFAGESYRRATGEGLSYEAATRLAMLIREGKGRLALPKMWACVERETLVFFPDGRAENAHENVVRRLIGEKPDGGEDEWSGTAVKAAYEGELTTRRLRRGERIETGGRTRSCRELLRAAGIPAPLREIYPVLVDRDNAPLILPFAATADRAKPKAGEKAVKIFWQKGFVSIPIGNNRKGSKK